MPRCEYCQAEFAEEDAYLEHLRDEHYDELGPIEQRRVDGLETEEDGNRWAVVGVITLLGVLVVAGGYMVFANGGTGDSTGTGGSGVPTPHDQGSVHIHGSMAVTIDGNQIDFSRDKYQLQDRSFHFERGNGERWHVHAKGVTLQYAMETLGINVTNNTVTYDGTTYRESDPGTTITITANGESVSPRTYVLKEGDNIRILVNTTE